VRVEYHSELDVRVVADGWMLLLPFEAKLFYPSGDEEWLIVPAGFTTDGASVPRIPGAYMLFGGRARKAATLHDYAYERRRNRAWADSVFLAAMEHEENSFVRGFMYAGVRLGGWSRYTEPKQWTEPPTGPYDLPPQA
jgi:hypothetical protein